MARYLITPDVVFAAPSLPSVSAYFAPLVAFTVWTDYTGGTDITSGCNGPDGTSGLNPLTDTNGQVPAFRTPDGAYLVWLDFGGTYRYMAIGVEALETVLGWADSGVTPGGSSGITGAPATWPATFPPSPHSHPISDITGTTTVGRQVVTAADGAAARLAIGAGTGSGNSNLILGTDGTTAAAGNHTHNTSNITGLDTALAAKVANRGGAAGIFVVAFGATLPTAGAGALDGDICFQPAS